MRTIQILCCLSVLSLALRVEAGGVAHFEAATGPQNYVVTQHPAVLPHLTPSVWWLTSYGRNPLVYRDSSGKQVGDAIVGHFIQSELAAAIGLFDRFEIGVAAPAYLMQGAGFDGEGLFGGGTGDIRLTGKAQLTPWDEGFMAALRISSDLLPVAQLLRSDAGAATLAGERIPNITPSLSVGYHSRGLRLAAEAGFLWRQSREVYPDALSMGSQVLYGAAAEIPVLSDDVFVTADLHGRAAPASFGSDRNRFPLQADLAVKHFIGPFMWSVGAGTGLVPDYGAPQARVFAGVGWYPRAAPEPVDSDGDGIADAQDACPSAPEDIDNFEDTDGCPDEDNDEDGVPDETDACPLQPETKNDFEDEDGCPDTPPPPPPPADPLVVVKLDRIEILEKVFFELDSDQILPKSYSILGRLARVLDSRPDIRLVRVEGHTDSNGEEAYNQELSRRRAESVMRFLVEAGGIAAERLVAEGYGESKPIDSNDTAEGRQNNRRVEFHIVEQDLDDAEEQADSVEDDGSVPDQAKTEADAEGVKSRLKSLVDKALDAPTVAIPASEMGEPAEGEGEGTESAPPEAAASETSLPEPGEPVVPEAAPEAPSADVVPGSNEGSGVPKEGTEQPESTPETSPETAPESTPETSPESAPEASPDIPEGADESAGDTSASDGVAAEKGGAQ